MDDTARRSRTSSRSSKHAVSVLVPHNKSSAAAALEPIRHAASEALPLDSVDGVVVGWEEGGVTRAVRALEMSPPCSCRIFSAWALGISNSWTMISMSSFFMEGSLDDVVDGLDAVDGFSRNPPERKASSILCLE